MAAITHDIAPLNRTEHGYAAIEGLAGTMVQAYLLRLKAPVDTGLVRQVLRQLVTLYPKLRAVIEPGLHFYHFRILPDNHVVDQLFDLAFQVEPHVDVDDPAALEAWHWRSQHQVLPLERGLGLRASYVPHPERPVLMLGVPHIFGDGMTMLQLIKQIMLGINGLPMEPMPLEAPSMIGAIAPEHWWQWPAKVWRSRAHKVAERKLLASVNIQELPRCPQPNHSTTGVAHGALPVPVSELRKAARQVGVSLNTFLTAAIAQTFLEQAPHDPKAAAVIRISVDLRRYYPKAAGHGPLWGNHVGAFLVIEQGAGKSVHERVRSVDASIKEGLARYARREMCWTYLLEELMPVLGRTLIGHIGVKLQRADRFPRISLHSTSLGDASSHVNPPGAQIQLDQLITTVTSISPLSVLSEFQGMLMCPMMWQQSETSLADINDFRQRLGQVMQRMAAQALAV
ncbi:MAG: hypothetical protein EOP38_12555 [Rubrivivax sp.]|nr:MAG: hypothetical protein EOP38_12555 [Rubrivivax sp.]